MLMVPQARSGSRLVNAYHTCQALKNSHMSKPNPSLRSSSARVVNTQTAVVFIHFLPCAVCSKCSGGVGPQGSGESTVLWE